MAWPPSRAYPVRAAWSKGAVFWNPDSLWHEAQSAPLKTPLCGSWWQSAHLPALRWTWVGGFTWQVAQATVACFPMSGNPVLSCSIRRVALKLSVVWHEAQTPSGFSCGSLWQSLQAANFATR